MFEFNHPSFNLIIAPLHEHDLNLREIWQNFACAQVATLTTKLRLAMPFVVLKLN